ncbi:MAG: SagB/ThcOx family dehydrogenase [Aquificae bacterium]|nr:SagB/ThcOx family dehydrogenase [Aquificota bacterium]
MGVEVYHEESKHHPHRFAPSPGRLDWRNQPEPFRFWEGAPTVELPLLPDPEHPYEALYLGAPEERVTLETLSKFLELALGISAWKEVPGSRWAVRMNPSSGNLHPTEAHLVIPGLAGLSGVYHYNPYLHALEKRAELPDELVQALKAFYGPETFLVVLTSVPWREAWKYGVRALRYCLLDAGHALGSLRFSAALKGWRVRYLSAPSDEELEALLGFDRVSWPVGQEEFVQMGLAVYPASQPEPPPDLPAEIVEAFRRLPFYGRPSVLSREVVLWEEIYRALKLIRKPRTRPERWLFRDDEPAFLAPSPLTAEQIIRRRRSGHLYDPNASVPPEVFLNALDKTLPRSRYAPFDAQVGVYSNLLLMLHRVEGFPKGLYAFVRLPETLELLKEKLSERFLWKRVTKELPLYLLAEGDARELARFVSCDQEIASDGAFLTVFLALFGPLVRAEPWRYRHLHWEAGLTGQVLYLEATAHLFNATGIGCFFDDALHEAVGLKDDTFQDLYHLTFGKAYEDPRLKTLPPYYHLNR